MLNEIGRIGVGCHVRGVSRLRSETPRVVKNVGFLVRGMVIGHGYPGWRSAVDSGFAQESLRQVYDERICICRLLGTYSVRNLYTMRRVESYTCRLWHMCCAWRNRSKM
eukprot:3729868-Pyramimonas_sp.AAC.1